jgi:hypothetical protein
VEEMSALSGAELQARFGENEPIPGITARLAAWKEGVQVLTVVTAPQPGFSSYQTLVEGKTKEGATKLFVLLWSSSKEGLAWSGGGPAEHVLKRDKFMPIAALDVPLFQTGEGSYVFFDQQTEAPCVSVAVSGRERARLVITVAGRDIVGFVE